MSERAKIRARRVTGNDSQQQREVARAIRVAREMALLPYSVRQVTHRSKGERPWRPWRPRDRGRADGPPPRHDGPPPTCGSEPDERADERALEARRRTARGRPLESADGGRR